MSFYIAALFFSAFLLFTLSMSLLICNTFLALWFVTFYSLDDVNPGLLKVFPFYIYTNSKFMPCLNFGLSVGFFIMVTGQIDQLQCFGLKILYDYPSDNTYTSNYLSTIILATVRAFRFSVANAWLNFVKASVRTNTFSLPSL